jgi:hypothetical protein
MGEHQVALLLSYEIHLVQKAENLRKGRGEGQSGGRVNGSTLALGENCAIASPQLL